MTLLGKRPAPVPSSASSSSSSLKHLDVNYVSQDTTQLFVDTSPEFRKSFLTACSCNQIDKAAELFEQKFPNYRMAGVLG